MATHGEAAEITALNTNRTAITETVTPAGTLQWFSDRLVEKNFLPRRSARGILSIAGVTADSKAGQLVDSVYTKMRGTAEQRRRWFNEFVDIFSHDGAYADLARNLRRSVGEGSGASATGGVRDDGGKASGKDDGGIAEDSGPPKGGAKTSQGAAAKNTTPEAPKGGAAKKKKPKTKDKKITPEDFEDFPEPTVLDLMEMAGMELIAKWREVGQALGFEDHDLDAIDENKRGNVQRCMTQVFQTWYDRDGNTSDYSWKKLAEAICSPVVGKGRLLKSVCDKLRAKYN